MAARAATLVAAAVTGLAEAPPVPMGADGAPTEAAHQQAEEAAAGCLGELGLAIVSEETGGHRRPLARAG